MLVSYNLGARNAFGGQMTAPTTQMLVGPDGIARPYLVQAGQSGFGQAVPGQPYGWSPYSHDRSGSCRSDGYAAYPAYQAPYPVQTQYVTERAVAQAPVRRVIDAASRRLKMQAAAHVAEERAVDRRIGRRGRRAWRAHGRQEGRARGRGHRRRRGSHLRSGETTLNSFAYWRSWELLGLVGYVPRSLRSLRHQLL